LYDEGELKTWPATPVRSIAAISQLDLVLDFVGLASLNGSSRGRPAIERFWILDFRLRVSPLQPVQGFLKSAIGNLKSKMSLCHAKK